MGPDGVAFDATYLLGRPDEKAPGILFLHGGPHSAYPASYLHALAFLASLGYNLVIPNYRCGGWQALLLPFQYVQHSHLAIMDQKRHIILCIPGAVLAWIHIMPCNWEGRSGGHVSRLARQVCWPAQSS